MDRLTRVETNRWMRAAGVLVMLAALTFGVVACGDDSPDADSDGGNDSTKEVNLAAFILANANSYSQKNLEGVKEAARNAGNVNVTAFDGKFQGSVQLTQIQDAVATGKYNAFVIFPNDGGQVAAGVQEAAGDGIKVVAAYSPIGTNPDAGKPQVEGVVGTVWHPTRPNGRDLAELTIEACKKEHADANPCRVAYISAGNALVYEKLKFESYKEQLATADQSIEVVAQQEGGFLPDPARNATENILQANAELDIIIASGDQMTLGAEQAVDDAGRGDEITLIGNGASTEGVAKIKAKRWFGSPVYLPFDEGKGAAQMAIDAVRGKQPAKNEVDIVQESPIGRLYTRDTAQEFTPQWSINN